MMMTPKEKRLASEKRELQKRVRKLTLALRRITKDQSGLDMHAEALFYRAIAMEALK